MSWSLHVSVRCAICHVYTSSPTEWVFDVDYPCMVCEYKRMICVDKTAFYRNAIGRYRETHTCRCGRSPTRRIERAVPLCGGCSVNADLTPYVGNVCFQRPYGPARSH